MAKIKGLGRGLDALLGSDDSQMPVGNMRGLVELQIETLQPGKYQPRMRVEETSLRELADSIKTQGMIQPILVRPITGSRYEIVAGERRWRAARLAGLTTVSAQVRTISDKEALAMALIENIQREDLSPLEQANGIQRLVDEFAMTHEAAAQAVGRSRATVTNLLRLLALTVPVRELMQSGRLDMGHARALLALSGMQQAEAAREVVARGLSVRETERLVAIRLRRINSNSKRGSSKTKGRDVLRLQEDLAGKLGAKVQIDHSTKGKGKLIIHYSSLDELQGILAHIK
jgi:ParB family transcriptional regulator, chromosome partitioning protein